MTDAIDLLPLPPAPHTCRCGKMLGKYHYTDGQTVELCVKCDAPHADELQPVVCPFDAATIERVAHWLQLVLENVHTADFDLVWTAYQVGRDSAHAQAQANSLTNSALWTRADTCIDTVRRYALAHVGARLEADRAAAVAAAYEADRAAKAATRKPRRRKAG